MLQRTEPVGEMSSEMEYKQNSSIPASLMNVGRGDARKCRRGGLNLLKSARCGHQYSKGKIKGIKKGI